MYPRDCDERRIGSKGEQLFISKIDMNHWLFRFEQNKDVGRDGFLELAEEGEWRNHKIECQIKGTKIINYIYNGSVISFQMKVKTLLYAVNSTIPFLLFLSDINNQIVYYLNIQDYFISDEKAYEKLYSGQENLNVHIDPHNVLNEQDIELQKIALKTYISVDGKVKLL